MGGGQAFPVLPWAAMLALLLNLSLTIQVPNINDKLVYALY